MLLALAMLRTVVLVAGLSVAGRWVVGLLSGASRDRNAVYQMLSVIAAPALKAARRVLPRDATDQRAALVAWLLALVAYFGLGLWERDLCLRDLTQVGCGNWAAARGQPRS
jgi:uncharacterized protein YggT (Ycf19 family)